MAGTEIYTQALVKELLLKNIEALVVIPNFGKTINETYQYEDTKVIQFAEPSVVDKALIMDKTIPEGLKYFTQIIEEEKPSIVHFHIVGGSNGITLRHVRAVKQLDIKIVMTFHLAGYSCKADTLMYKNKYVCDGVIDVKKCTMCVYSYGKMNLLKKNILYAAAVGAHNLHYDTRRWNNTLGTAIGFPFLIDGLKNKLLQLSAYCDKMVVLARWYKTILEKNGLPPLKLVLIEQGLAFPAAVRKDIKLAVLPLKLIFIGRIQPQKGIHLLIEAMRCFSVHEALIEIYGKEEETNYYKKCIADSFGALNIKWKGVVARDKVLETLSQYDLLCVPSTSAEMSPLVIQEAFAAGIPVLASGVYGNEEQIKNNENGWLFKFNDSNDLKNKIQDLIINPEMILAAARKIKPVKTFAAVADEYERLYNSIMVPSEKIISKD